MSGHFLKQDFLRPVRNKIRERASPRCTHERFPQLNQRDHTRKISISHCCLRNLLPRSFRRTFPPEERIDVSLQQSLRPLSPCSFSSSGVHSNILLLFPFPEMSITIAFPDLKTDAGLKALDAFLANQSFVVGRDSRRSAFSCVLHSG